MHYQVTLTCGLLDLRTEREDLPLEALLAFASRQNPRRGFLFVSRVLGKHIPCAPSRMRDVYDRLAAELAGVRGPVLAIGLAETATGLGAGVADSLARLDGRQDVLFQHTTRHRLTAQILAEFDEIHSHAPEHVVYGPLPALAEQYQRTATLALIDDEITTGRTLVGISAKLLHHLPAVREVVFISLVNWLDQSRRCAIVTDLTVPTRFVSLVEGTFSFSPRSDFAPVLPSRVVAQQISPFPVRADTGRRALRMPLERDLIARDADRFACSDCVGNGPISVIGTGELAYPPFLLAEALEQRGADVFFQGTTRSPILKGEAIEDSLCIADEHREGVQNYLHNPPARNRRAIVGYECGHHARSHGLANRLGAAVWVVPKLAATVP